MQKPSNKRARSLPLVDPELKWSLTSPTVKKVARLETISEESPLQNCLLSLLKQDWPLEQNVYWDDDLLIMRINQPKPTPEKLEAYEVLLNEFDTEWAWLLHDPSNNLAADFSCSFESCFVLLLTRLCFETNVAECEKLEAFVNSLRKRSQPAYILACIDKVLSSTVVLMSPQASGLSLLLEMITSMCQSPSINGSDQDRVLDVLVPLVCSRHSPQIVESLTHCLELNLARLSRPLRICVFEAILASFPNHDGYPWVAALQILAAIASPLRPEELDQFRHHLTSQLCRGLQHPNSAICLGAYRFCAEPVVIRYMSTKRTDFCAAFEPAMKAASLHWNYSVRIVASEFSKFLLHGSKYVFSKIRAMAAIHGTLKPKFTLNVSNTSPRPLAKPLIA